MSAIRVIDLNYLGVPQTIASYLLESDDGPVLVECGPASTLEALDAGLRSHGYSCKEVRHVVVTHIHLDHAGAAGHLARSGAMIHVHEFGAPHLADPAKLLSSAKRIYGDQMDRLWGCVEPVPSTQLVPIADGQRLAINGLDLVAIETPGHARHHHAFALRRPNGMVCFTGDIAAMIVPGHHVITIPTPPPEFDPNAWIASVQRLESWRFSALYLTHFGPIRTPVAHLTEVKRGLRSHVEYIRVMLRAGRPESELVSQYRRWVRTQALASGVREPELSHFVCENLLSMNVSGIVRYLRSTAEFGGAR